MKLLRETRTLKVKAVSSLRIGMQAFNSFDDDGRITTVLLHLQHACEMLLKAVLIQNKANVFDKVTGRSISFDRSLGLCMAHYGLTAEEAGVMRAVDSLRDAAQHWFVVVAEDLLYINTRALITAFDAYLLRALEVTLNDHIPARVLPVSTMPPGDFEFLMDREYNLVKELLEPGRRQRDEARGRIRSMLAMESIAVDEVEVSERDIDRIEKAVRAGQGINEVSLVYPQWVHGRMVTVSIWWCISPRKKVPQFDILVGMIQQMRRRCGNWIFRRSSMLGQQTLRKGLDSRHPKRKHCVCTLVSMRIWAATMSSNLVRRAFPAFLTMLSGGCAKP